MKNISFLILAISLTLFVSINYFNSISANLILFSLLYGFVFIFGVIYRNDNKKIDIFRPYFLTSILLFLYSFSGILFASSTGLNMYSEFASARSINIFIYASLLTQTGITIGFLIQSKFKLTRAPNYINLRQINKNNEVNYLLFFGAFFSIIFFTFIYKSFLPSEVVSYGTWALESRVVKLDSNISGPVEILFIALPTTLLICSLIHISLTSKYNIALRIIALVLIILYLYTQLLSGARAPVMITLLLIAAFINYRVYQFNIFLIFIGGFFVYILINTISLLRETSDPIEMIFLLVDQLSMSGLSFLSLQRSTELLTSLNALTIIEAVDSGQVNFRFGSLFLTQVFAFIPEIFWSGRPGFASEQFLQSFYPGIYEIGGGYGFTVVAEGYWELGYIGCVIYGAITGFMGERIYQLFLLVKNNDVYIFLYALIFSRLVVLIHRSGLMASIKAAIIVAIPIIFIIMIHVFLKHIRISSKENI